MLTLTKTVTVDSVALDAALRSTLGVKLFGVSALGNQLQGIHLDDGIVRLVDGKEVMPAFAHDDPELVGNAAAQSALAILAAHDPVFLTFSKTSITANGVDAATITVTCPRASPAPVVLIVAGVEVAVDLVDGVGNMVVTSLDPATITVSVKNGAFRNPAIYQVQIEAV